MDPLLDAELDEANNCLVRFFDADKSYSEMTSITICSVISLPFLLVPILLKKLSFEAAVLWFFVVILCLLGALWRRRRREQYFQEIKKRCLMLERAGYVVHRKGIFRNSYLAATRDPPADEKDVMDFRDLTSSNLRDRLYY